MVIYAPALALNQSKYRTDIVINDKKMIIFFQGCLLDIFLKKIIIFIIIIIMFIINESFSLMNHSHI